MATGSGRPELFEECDSTAKVVLKKAMPFFETPDGRLGIAGSERREVQFAVLRTPKNLRQDLWLDPPPFVPNHLNPKSTARSPAANPDE